jgi:hypothetical protein
MSNTSTGQPTKAPCCSFCNKSQHDVDKLIVGPSGKICNECIELCMDILSHEARDTEANKKILDDYVIERQLKSGDEHPNSLTTEEVDKLITLLGVVFGVKSLSAVTDQVKNGPAEVYCAGVPIGIITRRMEDKNSPYIFSMSIRNRATS